MEFSRSHVKPNSLLGREHQEGEKLNSNHMFEMKQYVHFVTAENFNNCFTVSSNKEEK